MQFAIPGCKLEPPKRVAGAKLELTFVASHRGELTMPQLLLKALRWVFVRASAGCASTCLAASCIHSPQIRSAMNTSIST